MIVAILAGLSVKALSLSQDSVTQLVTADDTLKAFEKIVRKPHSPHKATIMAMLLPGSGQIYNGQWWKVPILYGGMAADIYGIAWNQKRFKEYQGCLCRMGAVSGGESQRSGYALSAKSRVG